MILRNNFRSFFSLAAMAMLGLVTTSANADILSVDFGNNGSPVETGFVGQDSSGITHTTIPGNITVSYAGQQANFDRGVSGGTNNDLYRDFVFDNSNNGFTLTLSGAGIAASTDYLLTFYAFDKFDTSRSTTFNGISGTAGPTLGPVSGTADPTALTDYAVTGTYTSDGSGNLNFELTGPRTVINGFSLDAVANVPEPSSMALLGLGSLVMLVRRRRG